MQAARILSLMTGLQEILKCLPLVKHSLGVKVFGISAIDGHIAFGRFIELHFGIGEGEAFWLGWELKAAPVPIALLLPTIPSSDPLGEHQGTHWCGTPLR